MSTYVTSPAPPSKEPQNDQSEGQGNAEHHQEVGEVPFPQFQGGLLYMQPVKLGADVSLPDSFGNPTTGTARSWPMQG